MLHDERVVYSTIKLWLLETYFNGCRDHALTKKWSHEQIMGYVDYQFEATFERPIEQLMFKVVFLILSGGWNSDVEYNLCTAITNQLREQGLNNLLTGVPTDEVDLFKHDLTILKLI